MVPTKRCGGDKRPLPSAVVVTLVLQYYQGLVTWKLQTAICIIAKTSDMVSTNDPLCNCQAVVTNDCHYQAVRHGNWQYLVVVRNGTLEHYKWCGSDKLRSMSDTSDAVATNDTLFLSGYKVNRELFLLLLLRYSLDELSLPEPFK